MRTRVIGLTGGIASGKSTVGRMFAALGARVIDADDISRMLVRPGEPALAAIVAAFGSDVLRDGGELDRGRLAAIVFSDREARRRLEAILHPRIAARFRAILEEEARRGTEVLLYEASLLVETGEHRSLDGLIVVAASEETQIRRLRERDGLSEEEARRRLAAQAPLRDKIALADHVIDGDAPLSVTEAQVARVWKAILAGTARPRSEP